MENKDDILSKMNAYVFSAPIEAKIVIDSSDDENSQLDEVLLETPRGKQPENINITQNKIACPEQSVVPTNGFCSENDQRNENRKKYQDIKELMAEFQIYYDNDELENINPSEKNKCNNSNKRKLTNIPSSPIKIVHVDTNRSKLSPYLDQRGEIEQSANETHMQEQSHNTANGSTKSNLVSSESGIGNKYIYNLLKSVSDHLIIIMIAYYRHLNIKNTKSDPNIVQISLDQFNRIKNHFFSLSYCTAETILLPEENNVTFIKEFLQGTVSTANEKKIMNLKYDQIVPLYAELLQWTKQKKQFLSNFPTQNQPVYNPPHVNNNNPLLKMHLNMPIRTLPVSHSAVHQTQNNGDNPVKAMLDTVAAIETQPCMTNVKKGRENTKSCNYSFGPPGREININVDPAILNNLNQHNGVESSLAINQRPCNVNSYQYTQSAEFNQRNNSIRDRPTPYSIKPVHSNNYFTCNNSVPGYNNASMQRAPPPYRAVAPSPLQQPPQRPPPQRPPPQRLPPQRQAPHQLASQQLPPQQTLPQQSPPWFNQTPAWLNQQPIRNETIVTSQPETTRSLSTDSGFISPLNFNSPVNPMSDSCDQDERNEEKIPFITHVTSLNPNASYINAGPCHVCGKTTKLKCINCLNFYYCNIECQRADWSLHVHQCKKV